MSNQGIAPVTGNAHAWVAAVKRQGQYSQEQRKWWRSGISECVPYISISFSAAVSVSLGEQGNLECFTRTKITLHYIRTKYIEEQGNI